MRPDMRIIVITSCTGAKVVGSDEALTLGDFAMGREHVAEREDLTCPPVWST